MKWMATAPHMYPSPYSGPIWKTQPKHRIIENIPEVMTIISSLMTRDFHKLFEITYYTTMINNELTSAGSNLVITRIEYVQMINRFKKLGDRYIKTCVDRATILSEFSV